MTRKAPARERAKTDPEQLRRFKQIARAVEVDESEGVFDRAFERVIGPEPDHRGRGGESRRRLPRDPKSSPDGAC